MTIGFNQYQQAPMQPTYAPQPYAPMPQPYGTSYTLPIQPVSPQVPMKVDNYEGTRDKNVGDFVGGFAVGAGKAIYDMGHGLLFLGKVAAQGIRHPIESTKKVGSVLVHAVSNPVQTAESVITLPFKVAKGIVKPYSQALEQGRYGEALGRLTVDVAVIAASMGQKPAGTPTTPAPVTEPVTSVVDDVVGVVDDIAPVISTPVTPVAGGSATNTITNTLGDTILEKVVNLEGAIIHPGANVNISIGNIEVGKQVISGTVQASTNGGGALGKMVNSADDLAKVVTPVASIPVTPAVSNVVTPVVETAATVASSTVQASGTIGGQIGSGIDKIISAPGKVLTGIGNGINSVGNGLNKVGRFLSSPGEFLKGIDAVKTAEWIGNGMRAGADMTARGLVFAAQNPQQAVIIAGAVGRAGKATEDVLMEFDLVR